MAEKTTKTGKAIQSYIKDTLDDATKAADAAYAAGYPPDSRFTQAYYAGVPYLYQYGDAQQAEALNRAGGLYGAYGQAGGYNKTNFGDIEGQYGAAGQYDPTTYGLSDYTTKNIMDRMTPYEELVSGRAKARLEKAYKEGRGEREASAARQNAFGGSGMAIQEELARRNYLEQMADMDAQNLQSAYESGVGLYGREQSDNLAAQQATEASRQFGKNTQMAGLEGVMAARQQQAAQEAAAKEAQFKGLEGQSASVDQEAKLSEQQKNMQLANLNATREAGVQKEQDYINRANYPLDIAAKQANILSPINGGTNPVDTTKNKTSTTQNILGGVTAGIGAINAVQDALNFRQGGIVYIPRGSLGGLVMRGGGLADLEPQYYSGYEQ